MRSLVESCAVRVKAAVVWRLVQRRAVAASIDPGDLARIRRYARVAAGIEEPHRVDPQQRPKGYVEGLTARPWHDPRAFPCTAVLESRYEAIRRELLAVAETNRTRKQGEGLVDAGGWNVLYLHSLGSRVEANCALCPETVQAVEDAIGQSCAMGLVYLSAMAPGTRLAPHCGHTNARLRVHLGLVVPPGCEIRVASTTRTWEEGKCIVFDDSFEHAARNPSTRTRYVLVVDLWHPDLSDAEVFALREIMELSWKARRARARTRRSAGQR